MTNLLIYDPEQSCSTLLRSHLRTLGHRISISLDTGDAHMKLTTGLFDGVLVVSHADSLSREHFPQLGWVTLNGGHVEALLTDGRQLKRPRHLASIGDLVHRLGATDTLENLAARLDFNGRTLECVAADLRMPALLLEPNQNSEADFASFFTAVGEASFSTHIQLGKGQTIEGLSSFLYAERNVRDVIHRAAVTIA